MTDTAQTVYECPDCDWAGTANDAASIRHVEERVAAGELMAAGQCPDCGALLSVEDADVPDYTLHSVARIMQARGWLVQAPSKRSQS